jgi:transcriptional regulator with XRE-family HTH domain
MANFAELTRRLVDRLRWRIRCGEFTERALARRANLSQPHLHNVLKGERALSPLAADRLLEAAGMSVLDLLTAGEGDEARRRALDRDGPGPSPPGRLPPPGGPFRPN